jgi:hypothetical protein
MLIGARYWILCDKPRASLLMSPHDGRGWRPGRDEVDNRPWIPVSMQSHNGVYAAKSVEDLRAALVTEEARACLRGRWWESELREYEPRAVVLGHVQIWGKVVEHERGYRAEHARICSIDEIAYGPQLENLQSGGHDLRVLRLIYGVGARGQ